MLAWEGFGQQKLSYILCLVLVITNRDSFGVFAGMGSQHKLSCISFFFSLSRDWFAQCKFRYIFVLAGMEAVWSTCVEINFVSLLES